MSSSNSLTLKPTLGIRQLVASYHAQSYSPVESQKASYSKLRHEIGCHSNVPQHLWIFHATHDSLGPSEPIIQTASRSVQSFLHRRPQSAPKLYNETPLSPSKLPLPCGDLEPHLMHGCLAHPFPQPKRHLDWLSRFCIGLISVTDRQTDRQTTLYSVGSIAMRPNNNVLYANQYK